MLKVFQSELNFPLQWKAFQLQNAKAKQIVFCQPCKSPPGGGSIAKVRAFY